MKTNAYRYWDTCHVQQSLYILEQLKQFKLTMDRNNTAWIGFPSTFRCLLVRFFEQDHPLLVGVGQHRFITNACFVQHTGFVGDCPLSTYFIMLFNYNTSVLNQDCRIKRRSLQYNVVFTCEEGFWIINIVRAKARFKCAHQARGLGLFQGLHPPITYV